MDDLTIVILVLYLYIVINALSVSNKRLYLLHTYTSFTIYS